MALILILLAVSVFSFPIPSSLPPSTGGRDRHHEDGGRYQRLYPLALCVRRAPSGTERRGHRIFRPVGHIRPGIKQIAGNDTIHLITVIPFAQLAAPVAGISLSRAF
jgi:hypothetical protein